MKKYVVVEFSDTSIDLVPRNWIHSKEKTTKWPKQELTKSYYKCVEKMLPINKAWQSYSFKRLMTSSDNFDQARELMVEALNYSDFTSDAEKQKQNRRSRAKRNLSTELEDSEEVSGPKESGRKTSKKAPEKEPDIPPPPIWNKSNVSAGSSNPVTAQSTPQPSGSKEKNTRVLNKTSKLPDRAKTGDKRSRSRSPSPASIYSEDRRPSDVDFDTNSEDDLLNLFSPNSKIKKFIVTPRRSPSPTPEKTPPPRKRSGQTPSPDQSHKRSPSPRKSPEKIPSPKKSHKKSPSPRRSPEKTPLPRRSPEKTPSPRKSPENTPSPRRSPEKTPSLRKTPPPRKTSSLPKPSTSVEALKMRSNLASPKKSSPISKFFGIILKKLVYLDQMKATLDKILGLLEAGSTSGGGQVPGTPIRKGFLSKLPVKDVNDLFALEESLEDKKNRVIFRRYLAEKRSNKLKSCVQNFFKAAIDDGVLMEYNYSGLKGKGSFQNFKMYGEIKKLGVSLLNVSDEEFITAAKAFMKNAKIRHEKKNEKTQASN